MKRYLVTKSMSNKKNLPRNEKAYIIQIDADRLKTLSGQVNSPHGKTIYNSLNHELNRILFR